MSNGLTKSDRRWICDAFAKSLAYLHCYNAGEILWRDADRKPNIFRPTVYQHRHRGTKKWCPRFTRLEVNFSPPWRFRKHFWTEEEELDKGGPNYKMELTVLPKEADALARWLPLWLMHREGVRTQPLPDPPDGMTDLLLWQPHHRHVYFWSDNADKLYEGWLAEQKGIMACR